MSITTIFENIQQAKSITDIITTLQQATIFNYVQFCLDEKYDYHLVSNPNQPAQCTDFNGQSVGLTDLKDVIITVLG